MMLHEPISFKQGSSAELRSIPAYHMNLELKKIMQFILIHFRQVCFGMYTILLYN